MKRYLTVLAVVGIAYGAMAGSEPVQISLLPEIAIWDRTEKIEGLTLSLIWGENPQSALALGIINGSSGDSAGVSWGLLLNYADDYTGLQWAPINYTKGTFIGWQKGIVNVTGGRMKGFQCGTVNYAGKLTGLQLGLINYAETGVNGVQIGLLNILPTNRWLSELPDELAPGMILLNWRF